MGDAVSPLPACGERFPPNVVPRFEAMNLVGTPSSVSLILIWDAGTASLPPARFMERHRGEGGVHWSQNSLRMPPLPMPPPPEEERETRPSHRAGAPDPPG